MDSIKNSVILSMQGIRRAIALAALCVVVATATATWLGAPPAEAAPKPARAAGPAASAQATSDDAGEDEADAERRTSRGKTLAGKLNLNTATEEQLCMLPGVGPAKAQRIIEHRTKRGKFQRVMDLRRVKGFGYKTLKKLSPYLDVKGETTLAVQ